MKLFDKPWLEIVNIDMNAVLTASPNEPDYGDPEIGEGGLEEQ